MSCLLTGTLGKGVSELVQTLEAGAAPVKSQHAACLPWRSP